MTDKILGPGSILGIVGGGQLGRMIALAAADYGLKAHVYAPDADSPAFDVAARTTCAAYDDAAALADFARGVDVVTYEFENIPHATADVLARHAVLHPNARALSTTQDRLSEKEFINGLGIPTAPFRAVDTPDDLDRAIEVIGLPAVLKTRRFGYDGKGQRMLRERAEGDRNALFAEFGGAPLILEGFVPFEREVSVVGARGRDGSFAAYDLCENEHRDHILALTRVPAPGVSAETGRAAVEIARRIADALDYVGVLAVEMFLVREDGAERLVVNEIAPRVHNSGHWTSEGALTSQFAQHVRAVCGWPLGDAGRVGGLPVEMRNLIGAQADDWHALLAEPGAHLHLYGKGEARPGRKMGHVTRLGPGPTGS
ncbi:5-(carboxyamino)imidazole ribonucleotide synthase [Methylobacterium sp. UNC300MFChir4.1]|uniref:5-(carboxyamino)imidazole ribonucleotide synthase n=1 Tax=Methylobacterium TaxID=407 RepID=UPI0008BEF9C2|nr:MULTISPECIES: 5-(carboxyamino)imidazole ribonucleotide synthase [unclassified Methylobacterium]SEO94995.1 5-(carboxyamino)imidazole ribonucleotide synthase [Methylobacterium sp. UNC300MFChir4.1]SFE69610.1 5-(carboxyamino)imidazole ribonucleotide synthase [Methylobacterium sp. 13MFTsu3.1M2]